MKKNVINKRWRFKSFASNHQEVTLSRKNNPLKTRVLGVNSKYLKLRKGSLDLDLMAIKHDGWVVVSVIGDSREFREKKTTSTGPRLPISE